MQKLRRFRSTLMIALLALIFGVVAVQPLFAATNTFSNTTSITIPNSGAANPYPSTISVSGITDTVIDVNVTLSGLTHTFPDDLDILLVGPGGQSVLLMSDAGGSSNISGVNLTFDNDCIFCALPNYSAIASGTYRPTNHGGGTFPAPAPASPYGNSLNGFDGIDPNGTWSLYIVDDQGGDSGSLSGGWSLTITTGVAPTITSADYVIVPPGSSGALHTLTATGDPSTFLWFCTPPSLTYWYIGCFPALGGSNILGSLPSQPALTEGIYSIGVQARNGVQPHANQNFTLYVGNVPAFTSADNATFIEGTSGSFNVTTTGSPTITYSLSGAPSWLSIDSGTGVLSGTPDAGTGAIGSFTFNIIADNFLPGETTQSFTLYVHNAPTITSVNTVSVQATTALSHTFTATGNPAPTLSYVTGTLPAGVSLVGDVLSGTPTEPGTYTIDVTATNGVSPDATQIFTLNVTGDNPIITSPDSETVVNGTAFSHTFTATGDPAPTLSYVTGTLPAGVSLVGDVLSGTPTEPGTYTIDVTATNGINPDATQTFTLTVTGDAPTITSVDSVSVVATNSFSHTFTAVGNPTPTLSYVPGTLPAGVSLVGDVLSGTPTTPGTYTIDVTATNGVSPDAAQTFTLTVTGDAPTITSVETLYMEQEGFLSHTFTATGNPTPTLAYSAINLPPGLTLTGNTISGYAHLSGTYGVTVTATNGISPDATQNFVLVVGALPEPPPSPFAEDVNFLETTAVRTGVPTTLFDTILVRIMYQYGHSTQWLGSDMYNPGNVGIQGVINLGVQQAIDLSSGNGDIYWEGGATFCLHGQGTLIWMSAANTPRIAEIIGSYTVPEFPGYTCATLFEPGTLVLVSENPE